MNREKAYLYGKKYRILLVIAGVIFLLLLIQYTRQSWPFAKDRQVTTASKKMKEADGMSNDTNQHPRAAVQVDTNKLQSLGIQIETVRIDTIAEPIRAVATVVADESRVSQIHTRVSGWLEKLYVNKKGQQVKAGAPLAGIFSQEALCFTDGIYRCIESISYRTAKCCCGKRKDSIKCVRNDKCRN